MDLRRLNNPPRSQRRAPCAIGVALVPLASGQIEAETPVST